MKVRQALGPHTEQGLVPRRVADPTFLAAHLDEEVALERAVQRRERRRGADEELRLLAQALTVRPYDPTNAVEMVGHDYKFIVENPDFFTYFGRPHPLGANNLS